MHQGTDSPECFVVNTVEILGRYTRAEILGRYTRALTFQNLCAGEPGSRNSGGERERESRPVSGGYGGGGSSRYGGGY